MSAEEVIEEVAKLCKLFHAKEVILNGPSPKATARERSDLDIAVTGVDALAEAKQRNLSDSFVLSGTSAKFSITFDLSWKVMKDILVQYYAITGFVAGSPREVLREAYKANLISDESWMEMIKVRNELAHDYDCEIVKKNWHVMVEKYIDLFYAFEDTVKALKMEI